jgi:hypothetical protein
MESVPSIEQPKLRTGDVPGEQRSVFNGNDTIMCPMDGTKISANCKKLTIIKKASTSLIERSATFPPIALGHMGLYVAF